MEEKKFTNREADKLPLNKSKELMWQHIRAKTLDKKKRSFADIFGQWSGLFRRLAFSGGIAVVLIVVIVFGNFAGWFNGGLKTPTVYANFEMTADTTDSAGVASESTFTLKSSEDYSSDTIKEVLKVAPEVKYEVEKIGDGRYKIKPSEPLSENEVYSFSILSSVKNETTGETKQINFSWAYQVKDTFKITGSLPGDKTSSAPVNTGVEINFSHEGFDFENIEKYFEISPSIEGRFEKHQRVLSFVPKNNFKAGSLYTVKIKKGLPLVGSDQVLAEDFIFQFETQEIKTTTYNAIEFVRGNYEFSTTQGVALEAYVNQAFDSSYDLQPYSAGIKPATVTPEISVKIYQYANSEQYLQALKDSAAVPAWAYVSARNFRFETKNLSQVAEYKPVVEKVDWQQYIHLPDADLEEGYYLFDLQYGKESDQALVQITDLSTYLKITLTDSLFWVNDLESGQASKGASVEILNDGAKYKTDNEGTVSFKTPENWKKSWNDQEPVFAKITSTDGKELITSVLPYFDDYNRTALYWQSFVTDRSIYKSKDTVHFWGFIKAKNSWVKPVEALKMKLKKDWNTYVDEIDVELKNDGSFIGELKLKNYTPGYYTLDIFDGEQILRSIYLEVQDYVKPAYNVTVEANQKAVFAGEEMKFKVKSNFFDGTPVADLELKWGSASKIATDESGEAEIKVKAQRSGEKWIAHDYYMDLSADLAEESDIRAVDTVRIFDTKVALSAEHELKDGLAKIKVKANNVDLDKINNGENNIYGDYLGDAVKNFNIKGKVTEEYWVKVKESDYYDFINKKTVEKFRYEKRTNDLGSLNVTTDGNGEGFYGLNIKPDKFYVIDFSAVDGENNPTSVTATIYGQDSDNQEFHFYNVKILNGKTADGVNYFDYEPSKFAPGERVKTAIADNNVPFSLDKKGQFLFMQLSNGLQNYGVENSPYYEFTFDGNDIPNVYIGGVWFNGTTYYEAYEGSAYYDSDLAKLDIEVKSDKEKYKPGDEVILKVKVGDDRGGVKARVNFNLVDEAYFKVAYDNFVSPVEEIYAPNSTGILASYYSHKGPALTDGGKGGCFTEDTQILMADGGYKAIKDVKKGDRILTKRSEFSGELVPGEVIETYKHFVSEYLVVNENLEVTPVHILFVNGKWAVAGNLKLGDVLTDKDGNEVVVNSIREVKKPVWVYNFAVADYHTYFANDFYVHNDKGGDGEIRSVFEDTAFFGEIVTDSNGDGEVTFTLPDNITSWRTIVRAIDTVNLKAGHATSNIPVSLPFFTDLVLAQQYSIKDKPVVKFRSYGEALKKDDKVNYAVSALSLGVAKSAVTGKAFSGSYFQLPALKLGEHDLTLEASSGELKDTIKRPIEVVGSRLKQNVIEFEDNISESFEVDLAEEGMTEVSFVDAGQAYYYNDLLWLYYTGGERLDQRLSEIIGGGLLKQYFKEELEVADEDLLRNYQQLSGGLSLLPYSDADLRLSGLAALVDSDLNKYDRVALKNYFYQFYFGGKSNLDELVRSLAGLAAMKEPVLLSLREVLKIPEITVKDKLYLALGFVSLGSRNEAFEIYKEIVDGGLKGFEVEGYGLIAVLAAALQDENAKDYYEKLTTSDQSEELANLYQLGYLKYALKYAKAQDAKIVVKKNDNSEKVELGKFNKFSILATVSDKLSVEVVEGEIGVTKHYQKTVAPEKFKKNGEVKISRNYYVGAKQTSSFKEGDIVKVVLNVDYFGSSKDWLSFDVTDVLPSGLKPITTGYAGGYYYVQRNFPYLVDGQELHLYWSKQPPQYKEYFGNKEIVYYARVVNLGEFYADPAKIQSFKNPELVNISEAAVIEIK